MSPQADDFKNYLNELSSLVEANLSKCFADLDVPAELLDSMNYSLLAGGKRIRPVLCLSWAKMLGIKTDTVLDFACAIELIHTYSLMHDDLPSMDNDDLRRGKPTSHKVYGEAMAILAGDGLLTHAFYLMSGTNLLPEHVLAACREMAMAAGPAGMVGGQIVDIMATGTSKMDLAVLQRMHAMKTGALIRSSCVSAALLAQSSSVGRSDIANAAGFGKSIGLAFQIVDDILDITGDEASLGKPVGSDQSQDKATYPRFIGLEKSMSLAQENTDQAIECLNQYSGRDKEFLKDLAQYIVDRIN